MTFLTHNLCLQALAQREEAVRNGKLTTIIFIRDRNAKKQEISGYIDYAHRLKTENLEPIFECKKRLLPKPSDLSFFNWETQTSTSNPTPNFQVIADNEAGLLFKNKRDRKIINVDPKSRPGDNSTRFDVVTDEYLQVGVTFLHDFCTPLCHPCMCLLWTSMNSPIDSKFMHFMLQVVIYDHVTRRRT